MKKILLLIHDMQIGGAQKSLLAFCHSFAASPEVKNCELHLMPFDPTGAFMKQLPQEIRIVQPPRPLRWLGTKFSGTMMRKYFSWRGLIGEILWLFRSKLKRFPSNYNTQQRLWKNWKTFVPSDEEHYDVVISYMDGVPNYYAMDKVQADKKVLWVHNEYDKLGYDRAFDQTYFEECQALITISEKCKTSLTDNFPTCSSKIHILENITAAKTVLAQSEAYTPEEFSEAEGWKLLSVGRLNRQKGFDLAIESAKLLRDRGLQFLWLIVGEGTERENLQQQIEHYGLEKQIRLIGARENPYVYMKACDLLVQPSRWEGKSVVLDEAKILSKPIVATNYATVKDSIEHGTSGWIVDLSPEAVAEGIETLCGDETLRKHLSACLQAEAKGNEKELESYVRIMF